MSRRNLSVWEGGRGRMWMSDRGWLVLCCGGHYHHPNNNNLSADPTHLLELDHHLIFQPSTSRSSASTRTNKRVLHFIASSTTLHINHSGYRSWLLSLDMSSDDRWPPPSTPPYYYTWSYLRMRIFHSPNWRDVNLHFRVSTDTRERASTIQQQ